MGKKTCGKNWIYTAGVSKCVHVRDTYECIEISKDQVILSCCTQDDFFHKYRKTWEDQLYLLKITFLNVLNDTTSFLEKKKSREEKEELQCFEDFVEYVIRVNNFNRIKKDGKEEKIISEL